MFRKYFKKDPKRVQKRIQQMNKTDLKNDARGSRGTSSGALISMLGRQLLKLMSAHPPFAECIGAQTHISVFGTVKIPYFFSPAAGSKTRFFL